MIWLYLQNCPTPFAADSGFAAEGQRREPAEQVFGEGVLPAPPLPLKPTVMRRATITEDAVG